MDRVVLHDGTVAILLKERERHLRIRPGVPDGVEVELFLVRLPARSLTSPAMAGPGTDFSFTRNPRNLTKEFAR